MRPSFITKLMKKSLFLLLMLGGLSAANGQTNPTAHDLSASNYTFTGFGNGTTTTYPTSMQGWRFSSEPGNTFVGAPTGDRVLDVSTASAISGNIKNEVGDGLSFLNSSSNNIGAVVVAVNATGRSNLMVSWSAEDIRTGSTRTNGLKLQYRIGTSGDFTDVASSTYLSDPAAFKAAQTFTNIALPAAVDGEAVVQIRWLYFFESGSGSRDRIRLDEITVASSVASNPTVTLSSPAQVSVGNVNQGAVNHTISAFQAAVTDDDATVSEVSFTSSGTYGAAGDLSNYRLWYNSADNFAGAINLSTVAAGVTSGSTVTFTGLSQTIAENATGYFWITVDVSALATATQTIFAGSHALSFSSGNQSGSIADGGVQTIQSVTPLLSLSSPNPSIAAGTFNQNSTNNVVYRFDMGVTVANTAITAFDITTTGSYAANGVSNLKAWYSTNATFDAGSDVLLTTIAAPTTAGVQSFSGFNQTLLSGNTHYIFVTVDVSCDAVDGATLGVAAITTADITTTASKSGSAFASGTHSLQEVIPNNATSVNSSIANQSITIRWTNPTGCFDEVMVVAKAGSSISGTPTGNGGAYTADLDFTGSGTAFDGGKVVYKGTASPQTITGLTNGTQYFVRIFTRNGESWSAGVEINESPAAICGFEDFSNSSLTSAYLDGSFVGNNGVTWTYVHSRDQNNDANGSGINGKAIMLRSVAEGSKVTSSAVAGGIGNFSCKLYKGFTGAGNRQVELFVNGVSKGTSTPFDNFAEQTFTVNNINIFGDIVIEIRNITTYQVIIDDISWTCFETPTNTWNGSVWSEGQAPQGEHAVIAGNLAITTGFNCSDLTINNGATVTLAAGQTLTVNGDFTNNGTLTLEATDENTYAQLITNGTVSGNVTVQRAITGSTQGWRFISPAVSGTLANLGSSVQLTGAANVIRLNTNNSNAWVAQGGAGTDALVAGKGYVAYYGNDGVNGSNVATTLSLTGALNNSDVTVSGLSDGNGTSDFGWSVVGNPFAAGIDFSNTTEVALTNMEPAYYIWRPVEGNYATWHRSSGSAPAGILNGTIAPMQGFLVKANAGSPVLTINRAARTSASTGAQYRTSNLTDRLYIKVRHTGDNRSDEAMLAAAPLATMNFESDFDALKAGTMSTTAYSISTRSADNRQLAINTVAAFDASVSVPVRITGNQPGPLSIEVNLDGVSSTAPIMLEDLYLNRNHDLRAGAYNYAHVPAQTDRFVIHFAPLATSVAANGIDQVQVYTFEGNLYIRGMEQAEQLRITDMRGRVVYQAQQLQLNGEALPMQLAKGNYLVQVVGKQGVKTAKVQF